MHLIFNPNMNTLQPAASAPNEFFNKTAERLVGKNITNKDVILSHIYLYPNNTNSFRLQKQHTMKYSSVSSHYEMVLQLYTTTSQFR